MSQDLRTNPLSHSFVAAFNAMTTGSSFNFPVGEDLKQLLMPIFGDPVNTVMNLAPTGIQALLPGQPVVRNAEFGPLRLQAMTPSPEETSKVFLKLYTKWIQCKIPAQLQAVGLNYEFEFSLGGINNVEQWIGERFISKSITLTRNWSVVAGKVSFTLKHPEGFLTTVNLEPRAAKPNYFFCNTNNHYEAAGFSGVDLQDGAGLSQRLHSEYERSLNLVLSLISNKRRRK
jgi:hypothetical protein